eukprot:1145759-Pelagomonas_calceolata.AAC.3
MVLRCGFLQICGAPLYLPLHTSAVSGPHEIMGKHAAFVRCPIARKNYVVLSSCAAVRHEPASLPPSSRHKDSAAQKVSHCQETQSV